MANVPPGDYYFFSWRCSVCQDIAATMIGSSSRTGAPHEPQSHPVRIVERKEGPICAPHLRTEDHERPYGMVQADLDEVWRELETDGN